MSKNKLSIMWFKEDLRINDNPALFNSLNEGLVIPLYIFDNSLKEEDKMGEASKWWLHHSLSDLNKNLNDKLSFFIGNPLNILENLIDKNNVENVFWNRSYEPSLLERDKIIKKKLLASGIIVKTYNASLLWESHEILKEDKTPYRVFTPFYRKGCLNNKPPRSVYSKPKIENLICSRTDTNISELCLLGNNNWHLKFNKHWKVGEINAQKKLSDFIKTGLSDYKNGRNFPAKNNVSKLSPHIHFGEISPHTIWNEINKSSDLENKNIEHFKSELGWREFSKYLLFHFPEITNSNFQKKFDNFPWIKDDNLFTLWKKGKTGYPIVDAGMRELWETGYVHNRVRMIVSSFLVKNLLIDWRLGERWFWECLVDADQANNKASWQWVAGSGADAAPYFRIFNPVTQGMKFDPDGDYTKKYVPELRNLDIKYLFNPWEADFETLENAGITLGKNYPKPIVDLKSSRNKALEIFSKL